jgi:macrolide transport system ATP-binding/permease protein
MSKIAEIWRRAGMVVQRRKIDRELAEELRLHKELKERELRAQGVKAEEAGYMARRNLGNLTGIRETVYEMNSIAILDGLWRDLRYATRTLRKRPMFTFIVVLSLALSIGANTAIFSVVDALVMRPAPVPNGNQLVFIDTAASRLTQYGGSSYLDFLDFRARAKTFQDLLIFQSVSMGMALPGTAQEGGGTIAWGLLVSGNFFSGLQVPALLGRTFSMDEDRVPNGNPVAVVSYTFWERAFARDPNIVNKQINLNGHSFTVVGVTPKWFTGVESFYHPDIYVPTMMSGQVAPGGGDVLTHRDWRGFGVLGRLNPGVSLAQSQAEMNVIMSELEREHPETNKDTVAIVRNEVERRREANGLVWPVILMGLVVLVLLMACANVASLMMAKATSRLRELSTQIALGATRAQLVRKALVESALLTTIAGAAGMLLGYGCIRVFTTLVPHRSASEAADFRLDLRVLGYAIAAGAAATLLCGLVPALVSVKEAWRTALNTRTGVSANASLSIVARRVLIGGQIGLSTILLIAAGLFLQAFTRAQSFDLGFNPDHVLLVTLDPGLQGYSGEKSIRFNGELLKRVSNVPGVESASLAGFATFMGGNSWDLSIDGYTAPGGEKFIDTATNQIGPHYFETMQIPLLCGREFTEQDVDKAPHVAVVNENLARKYIVEQGDLAKALGHVLRLRDGGPIRIVGVVKDSNFGQIGGPAVPVFYLPYLQEGNTTATLHVRTAGDPASFTAAIRQEIAALDPQVAVVSVITMVNAISERGLFMPRILAICGGAFGAIALVLAVIGLYGVASFMVGRRTQEIGIRMALGAQKNAVLRMVLANGVSLAIGGLVAGLAGGLVLAPLVRGMLMGISPRDPWSFAGVAVLLLGTTVAASWIPAHRAARLDPMVALRYE